VATQARKFQVGVFVIGALVIATGATLWLGASRFFENSTLLVSYYSESVQGVEPGAPVKYRGVPAGRVDSIDIAPDGHLIQVTMSIPADLAEALRLDETLRAQLQLSGITGLRYVEIDRHSGDTLYKSPKLSFDPPYPVIESTPSSFTAIQAALEDVYDHVMKVDLAGATDDLRATLQAADQILRDDRVQQILTNIADVSESASRVTANVERLTEQADLTPTLIALRDATVEAKDLFHDLREGETGKQVRKTLRDIDDVAHTAEQFMGSLQVTIERLDRTVVNLERLTDEVRRQPSRLLFSDPPAPRQTGGQR
jgi:ABC-type transporter Mla subunit MlaD